MAKARMRSLSDLMPAKGSATQPEPTIEQTREHSSKLASNLASSQQILLTREQDSLSAEASYGEGAASKQARVQNPDASSEYRDGPRSAVSFRMTARLQDRLREYAHQTRRTKQEVLDDAVHEFLRREGF